MEPQNTPGVPPDEHGAYVFAALKGSGGGHCYASREEKPGEDVAGPHLGRFFFSDTSEHLAILCVSIDSIPLLFGIPSSSSQGVRIESIPSSSSQRLKVVVVFSVLFGD